MKWSLYLKPSPWLIAIAGAFWFHSETISAAGLQGSKHDLGAEGDSRSAICVFCHAPDAGNETTADGEVVLPLWNKSLDQQASFNTYDSLGMATSASHSGHGSVSIACLSCHDGAQAPDVEMGRVSNKITVTGAAAGTRGASRAVHPFGIAYKGHDQDDEIEFYSPSKLTINGSPVWWVDSGNRQVISIGGISTSSRVGQREKTDIQLYSKVIADDGEQLTRIPFVECASCHNPHSSETSTFLRFDNIGSALCLSCHIK
jgi:predicted CXXCH cytochrome family protein